MVPSLTTLPGPKKSPDDEFYDDDYCIMAPVRYPNSLLGFFSPLPLTATAWFLFSFFYLPPPLSRMRFCRGQFWNMSGLALCWLN